MQSFVLRPTQLKMTLGAPRATSPQNKGRTGREKGRALAYWFMPQLQRWLGKEARAKGCWTVSVPVLRPNEVFQHPCRSPALPKASLTQPAHVSTVYEHFIQGHGLCLLALPVSSLNTSGNPACWIIWWAPLVRWLRFIKCNSNMLVWSHTAELTLEHKFPTLKPALLLIHGWLKNLSLAVDPSPPKKCQSGWSS